jgi:hypothetical protein
LACFSQNICSEWGTAASSLALNFPKLKLAEVKNTCNLVLLPALTVNDILTIDKNLLFKATSQFFTFAIIRLEKRKIFEVM